MVRPKVAYCLLTSAMYKNAILSTVKHLVIGPLAHEAPPVAVPLCVQRGLRPGTHAPWNRSHNKRPNVVPACSAGQQRVHGTATRLPELRVSEAFWECRS